MTKLVDPTEIEGLVGAIRDPELHLGQWKDSDEQVYILHSKACLDSGKDLRRCEYSRALDRALDMGLDSRWYGYQNRPVVLHIVGGQLIPRYPMEATDAQD